MENYQYIVTDPTIRNGRTIIKGTHLEIALIIRLLNRAEQGSTDDWNNMINELKSDLDLTQAQIDEVIRYYNHNVKQPQNEHDILAQNLTLSGYGANKNTILTILNKLSVEEIKVLTYNYYRTAEKIGYEAFDTTDVYEG